MENQLNKVNRLILQVESQLNHKEGVGWQSHAEKRRLEHYLQRLQEKKVELENE